jgi:hypothetical protein
MTFLHIFVSQYSMCYNVFARSVLTLLIEAGADINARTDCKRSLRVIDFVYDDDGDDGDDVDGGDGGDDDGDFTKSLQVIWEEVLDACGYQYVTHGADGHEAFYRTTDDTSWDALKFTEGLVGGQAKSRGGRAKSHVIRHQPLINLIFISIYLGAQN